MSPELILWKPYKLGEPPPVRFDCPLQAHPAAPGELMEIDSTPLDVLVLLDDGVPGRVQLTGLIDVATRTVPAAVIRPTTKSVDASVLLARALMPEPMRPGWPQSLAMAHSALPYDRLLSIDERLRHAAARPVIAPDTIVIDHGHDKHTPPCDNDTTGSWKDSRLRQPLDYQESLRTGPLTAHGDAMSSLP
jgi:hypothetical protein